MANPGRWGGPRQWLGHSRPCRWTESECRSQEGPARSTQPRLDFNRRQRAKWAPAPSWAAANPSGSTCHTKTAECLSESRRLPLMTLKTLHAIRWCHPPAVWPWPFGAPLRSNKRTDTLCRLHHPL